MFVCQYTNSYFSKQMASAEVKKYADGFIKGTEQNASFYGIIRPQQLVELVTDGGMKVSEWWRHEQSAYVVATPE